MGNYLFLMQNNKLKLQVFAICLCFISFIISSNLHTHDSFDYNSKTDAVEYSHPESHDDIHSYCTACLFSQNHKFGHENVITLSSFSIGLYVIALNHELKYINLLTSLSYSRAPPLKVIS